MCHRVEGIAATMPLTKVVVGKEIEDANKLDLWRFGSCYGWSDDRSYQEREFL